MQNKPDEITITILEDGTIRMETDNISGPNHLNAEQFLAQVGRLAGGETKSTRKSAAHTHATEGIHHTH